MTEPKDVIVKNRKLSDILDDHKLWLNTKGKEGKKADLSGETLENINLSGVDLSEANLSKATLKNINWNGADLSRADLNNATILGINWISLYRYNDINLEGANGNLPKGHVYKKEVNNGNPYNRVGRPIEIVP